jgi:hypothetical protein
VKVCCEGRSRGNTLLANNKTCLPERKRHASSDVCGRARQAAQRMLLSEIDRWVPIIKASGQYAD